jgi:hypothetical protein
MQLNENRENLDDTNIPEVDQQVNSLKTNEEKIQFLYRYLQNNYRYVSIQLGIGGWQAQTAKYTLQQKFGDCKALVTIMKGLPQKSRNYVLYGFGECTIRTELNLNPILYITALIM